MFSRMLLVFIAFSMSAVCSSTLGPSPDNSLERLYLVNVDPALYHYDCKKYEQLLGKLLHERSPKDALIYCYNQVVSGFAAVLTEEEAEKLKGEKGIFRVTKDVKYTFDVAPYDYESNNN
ncbi:unnamed protein product [Thlaspi arvense]|uniref:Inhibitor I9 domain-containing protein n=1 Tax=Thlaspi arvense TaxID=13288 RepID=A0AAU9S9B9_THLAR|nr:unnamed protein product [Thlaspi arvense]